MTHHFIVHPFKLIVGLITTAFLISGGLVILQYSYWWLGIVFFLLSIPFLAIAVVYGTVVHMDDRCIRSTFLGFTRKELSWNDIAEIGVIGTKIFHPDNADKVGTLYLYISETPLTDEERFDMGLRWPPTDKIILRYSEKRGNTIQMLSGQPLEKYNTGSMTI